MPNSDTKLRRSGADKVIFGVCGGLADYFRLDSLLVRLVFVILALASLVGVVIYLVLALAMPREEKTAAAGAGDVVRDNLQAMPGEAGEAARKAGEAIQNTLSGPKSPSPGPVAEDDRRRHTLALVLILIGVVLVMVNVGAFFWFRRPLFWALVLILVGVAILVGRKTGTKA